MTLLAHQAGMMASAAAGNVDSFDSNTISFYTSSVNAGTAAWALGAGVATVTPSAGAQGTLTRNGISYGDGWVEVDITKANDAGIVLNWQDNTHYLLATIDDASSDSGNANRIRIFSRTGATFTAVGSAATISFVRNAQHTVRLTRVGSAVSASFDGTVVASGTDTTNNVAGSLGMRANGSGSNVQSSFNELRWS